MSNTLTRTVEPPKLLSPATPGTPGAPGVPAKDAYSETVAYSEESLVVVTAAFPPGPSAPPGGKSTPAAPIVYTVGDVQYMSRIYAVTVTGTRVVYHPAQPAVPARPPTLARPAVYSLAGAIGWSGGARSAGVLGEGAASFRAGANLVGAAIGLRASPMQDYSFTSVDHGFYLSGGLFSVIERGRTVSAQHAYSPAKRFSIEHAGGTVRYFYDGAFIQSSVTPLSGSAYLNASLYAGGDAIVDAELSALVSAGVAEGRASFLPLASTSGDGTPENRGYGAFLPMTSSATGETPAGAMESFLPLVSLSGDKPYASGTAVMRPMTSAAVAESAPIPSVTVAVGSLQPLLSAAASQTANAVLDPWFCLTDTTALWLEAQWTGFMLYIVSGTGAGQSREVVANLKKALIINTAWGALPDATSRYEIRLGTSILRTGYSAPQAGTFVALASLASVDAYAGASGALQPMTSFGAQAQAKYILALLSRPSRAQVRATVHDATGENAFVYTAKRRIVRAFTGAQAKLTAPRARLVAEVLSTTLLKAVLSAPRAVVLSSATVGGVTSARLVRRMRPTVVSFTGLVSTLTAPKSRIVASITAGATLSFRLLAPRPRLLAAVTAQGRITALLTAPRAYLASGAVARLTAPRARLTAHITAVVAVTYEAYSINLSHRDPEANDEVTRYTNFPFDRIVRYQGGYFGVAADGLYLLEGTTDHASPTPTAIPYAVKTCIDDFKAPELKTVAAAYFGGRIGPDMTVTLFAGETGEESYDYSTPRGQGAQNHREKFGRGVKNRYFAIGVAGEGALELDLLELETATLTRRI